LNDWKIVGIIRRPGNCRSLALVAEASGVAIEIPPTMSPKP